MRDFGLVLCLLALGASAPVCAQSARKEGGNNQQLLQQMQQLAAERTRLQAENARMKRELDDTRKERDALRAGKDSDQKRARNSEILLAKSVQEREQDAKEREQLQGQTRELVAKFRETIQQLRTVETEGSALKQELATRQTELKTCVGANVALYQLNDEILTRFESQGFWSAVARAEPFTKLKRVELENLAQDYRDRATDAQVPTTSAAPAASVKPAG